MRIPCPCGHQIHDSTDAVLTKAWLVADEDLFTMFDAIDAEATDPLAAGRISLKQAHIASREAIRTRKRLMYQCPECGRLLIYRNRDFSGPLAIFVPETPDVPKDLLRSR